MEKIFDDAQNRMKKTLHNLENNYKEIQAGRANVSILDKVMVDYYGTPTPINQVAAVSVAEARVLNIQPWDVSVLQAIEKAIQKADLGVNPQSDGKLIRLIFPQLTEDRRKTIAKDISKMAEDAKIAVRNTRRDAINDFKEMKKSGEISEDDVNRGEKRIQNFTDTHCAEIDKICADKTEEVMKV